MHSNRDQWLSQNKEPWEIRADLLGKIRKHFIEEMIAVLGIKDKQDLDKERRNNKYLQFPKQ